MNSTDELKTVIALAGNRRLLHLEDEIFANESLTTLYLHTLCGFSITTYTGNHDNAALVLYYAMHFMHERWPQAEHILNDPRYYKYYKMYMAFLCYT